MVAQAKETALQDGHHVPLLILEGNRGLAMGQIQDMPDTHGARMELMRRFGEAAGRSGRVGRLAQVFFVSEGWMSVATRDKPPELRPSQDPDRREVLIISGLDMRGLGKSLRILEMVRNEDKRVVDLQELVPPGGEEGAIEIPLLDAFAEGFEIAFLSNAN